MKTSEVFNLEMQEKNFFSFWTFWWVLPYGIKKRGPVKISIVNSLKEVYISVKVYHLIPKNVSFSGYRVIEL